MVIRFPYSQNKVSVKVGKIFCPNMYVLIFIILEVIVIIMFNNKILLTLTSGKGIFVPYVKNKEEMKTRHIL